MNPDTRYYYVDAQNQATGPITAAALLALRAAGTITDGSLVIAEGGTDWVSFATLTAPTPAAAPTDVSEPTPGPTSVASVPTASSSPGAAEPAWAFQLSQKIDQLTLAMDKLASALEKSRPSAAIPTPATAALHAEKINLNPTPKSGIAGMNPNPSPGIVPRPTSSTTLSPLAVPANAQKSALPLPALGQSPAPAPAKGNVFSKFLKK